MLNEQGSVDFPGRAVHARPLVVGDLLFVGTMEGNLYAFDVESGAEVWDKPFEANGAIADLGIAGPGVIFVPTLRNEVSLVNIATGREAQQTFEASGWVWTSPVVRNGVAYFGDFSGTVYALDITSGRVVWRYRGETKVKAQPALIGDTLVVADEGATVHFIDIDDGTRKNECGRPSKKLRA